MLYPVELRARRTYRHPKGAPSGGTLGVPPDRSAHPSANRPPWSPSPKPIRRGTAYGQSAPGSEGCSIGGHPGGSPRSVGPPLSQSASLVPFPGWEPDESQPTDSRCEKRRRGRDSNPGATLWAATRLPSVLFQPLRHLSIVNGSPIPGTASILSGGEGGIRTHESLSALPVFGTGRINHSRTSPRMPNALTIFLESVHMLWIPAPNDSEVSSDLLLSMEIDVVASGTRMETTVLQQLFS